MLAYNNIKANPALFMGIYNHTKISYQWKLIKQQFKTQKAKIKNVSDIIIFKWALEHDLIDYH
jgi:hypothetical protein